MEDKKDNNFKFEKSEEKMKNGPQIEIEQKSDIYKKEALIQIEEENNEDLDKTESDSEFNKQMAKNNRKNSAKNLNGSIDEYYKESYILEGKINRTIAKNQRSLDFSKIIRKGSNSESKNFDIEFGYDSS